MRVLLLFRHQPAAVVLALLIVSAYVWRKYTRLARSTQNGADDTTETCPCEGLSCTLAPPLT
jgi:hypothetical protein